MNIKNLGRAPPPHRSLICSRMPGSFWTETKFYKNPLKVTWATQIDYAESTPALLVLRPNENLHEFPHLPLSPPIQL